MEKFSTESIPSAKGEALMFGFLRKLFSRTKRFVFVHVDYMGEIQTFKVRVKRGRVGITYLYDPLILRLQPNGKTTIDDKTLSGYGKETTIATWSETTDRPYVEKSW